MTLCKRSKRVSIVAQGADDIILLTINVLHRPLDHPVIKLLPENKWINTDFSKSE